MRYWLLFSLLVFRERRSLRNAGTRLPFEPSSVWLEPIPLNIELVTDDRRRWRWRQLSTPRMRSSRGKIQNPYGSCLFDQTRTPSQFKVLKKEYVPFDSFPPKIWNGRPLNPKYHKKEYGSEALREEYVSFDLNRVPDGALFYFHICITYIFL